MSWTARNIFFQQLEKSIEKNDKKLDDLIHEDNILVAAGQQLPNLSLFLANNIIQLIDIAIGKSTNSSPNDPSICHKLLTSRNSLITEALTQDPRSINYIAQQFHQDISMVTLISLFKHIIEESNGNALQDILDSTDLIKTFLHNLHNGLFCDILVTMCSKKTSSFQDWFESTHLVDLILEYLDEPDASFVNGILILNTLIMTLNAKSPSMLKLSSVTIVNKLFRFGIESTDREISGSVFRFLMTLSDSCDDDDFDDKPSNFKQILDYFTENAKLICNYVMKDNTFYQDKRYAVAVINTLIFIKDEIDNHFLEVFLFLFDLFFKLPTNSFLHSSVFTIFNSIMEKPTDQPKEFILKENLICRVFGALDNRDSCVASYWGHLMKMAEILKKNFDDEKLQEYQNYIGTTLQPKLDIINKDYGGQLPKVDDDDQKFAYKCQYVDSCDLIDEMKFTASDEYSSSSSSSSTSGESTESDSLDDPEESSEEESSHENETCNPDNGEDDWEDASS